MARAEYTPGRMDVRLLTSSDDLRQYDFWVRSHPAGSLWQSLEWKTYQESLGREVRLYAAEEDGKIVVSALVVIDRTRFGLSMWEIPRGPLGSEKWKVESGKLVNEIIDDAKRARAVSLYVSPPSNELSTFNFLPRLPFRSPRAKEGAKSRGQLSTRLVYPEATRIIDLTLSEDDLLAQMKPKGRYNIRLAEKRGVKIVQSDDVESYAALAGQTCERDGFRGPGKRGYECFLKNLPGSFLLLAYAPPSSPSSAALSAPVAGLLGVIWGSTGLYYYGASSHSRKELMAPYLLQWETMRYCKARGCARYDLFGIAPDGRPDHPWSGISDFKTKFGGTVEAYPPEQELVLRPAMKNLLKLKRKILG